MQMTMPGTIMLKNKDLNGKALLCTCISSDWKPGVRARGWREENKQIGTTKAKILGVNTKTTKEKIAIMNITLEVENLDELNKAQKAIRKVDSVYEVRRKL